MSKVIKKQNGQITVNIPNEIRIEAVLALAEAQAQMAKTNLELARALNAPVNVSVSNCNFVGGSSQLSPLFAVNTDDKQTHIVDIDDEEKDEDFSDEMREAYEDEQDEI